jgi:hypothetical protein
MPAQTHDFLVSTIPTVPDEAAMPDPASDPAAFAIARVGGTDRILVWFRTYIPVDVGVQLTNSVGQTDMATEIL